MPTFLPVNHWLFQLANVFLFLSYISTNVLILRIILTLASLSFVLWSALVLNFALDAFIWNLFFTVLNLAHACYLLYEMRPVVLSEELEIIYEEIFKYALTKQDFKRLSDLGYLRTLKTGTVYVKAGNTSHCLSIIISGEFSVRNTKDRLINTIGKYEFIDSPQYVTRKFFTEFDVSIISCTDVKYYTWPYENIDAICAKNANISHAIESVIGVDIAKKLFRTDKRGDDPNEIDVHNRVHQVMIGGSKRVYMTPTAVNEMKENTSINGFVELELPRLSMVKTDITQQQQQQCLPRQNIEQLENLTSMAIKLRNIANSLDETVVNSYNMLKEQSERAVENVIYQLSNLTSNNLNHIKINIKEHDDLKEKEQQVNELD